MDISRRKLVAIVFGGSVLGSAGYLSQRGSNSDPRTRICTEEIDLEVQTLEKQEVYRNIIDLYSTDERIQLTIVAIQNDVAVSAAIPPNSTADEDQIPVEQVSTDPPQYTLSTELTSDGELGLRVTGSIPEEPNQSDTLLDITEPLANDDSVTVRTEFEKSEEISYSIMSQSNGGTLTATVQEPDGSVLDETEYRAEGEATIPIESAGEHEITFSVEDRLERSWELVVKKHRSVPQAAEFSLSGFREYSSVSCTDE